MGNGKIIVFTCNWNAYSGLESAGVSHQEYGPEILPIKLMCLGRMTTGNILKAFEKGTKGVLLLGCPEDECQYDFGIRHARGILKETRELLELLGISPERLRLHHIGAGEGDLFVEKIKEFAESIDQFCEKPIPVAD